MGSEVTQILGSHSKKNRGTPPSPLTMLYLFVQRGVFSKVMTLEGLVTMFESEFADTFPMELIGGRAVGLECADPGLRTPIGASGNFIYTQYWLRKKQYFELSYLLEVCLYLFISSILLGNTRKYTCQ